MDEEFLEANNPKQAVGDKNMSAVTVSLEMLDLQPLPSKRLLRKRLPKRGATEFLNRRCSLRPKKRTCTEMESDEDIKDYYLDKTLKRNANHLETIFEETPNSNENSRCMSVKRYKRMIQFQQQPTDSKLKKRRTKIKKVFGSKVNFRQKLGSMKVLLDKLNYIRSNSPINSESEIK